MILPSVSLMERNDTSQVELFNMTKIQFLQRSKSIIPVGNIKKDWAHRGVPTAPPDYTQIDPSVLVLVLEL